MFVIDKYCLLVNLLIKKMRYPGTIQQKNVSVQ